MAVESILGEKCISIGAAISPYIPGKYEMRIIRSCYKDYGIWGKRCLLFFMISRFITFVSVKNKYGDYVNIKEYYLGRAARILPVYYTAILYNHILHTFVLHDVPIDETGFG